MRKETGWDLPPTPDQIRSITKACHILNYDITEPEMPQTRLEARDLLFELWGKVRAKGKK